jgi:uncharacterized protein (DUF362 family)
MALPVVAIVENNGDGGEAINCLPEALDAAKFWETLYSVSSERKRTEISIIIKPDLGGFEPGSPLATSPVMVEELIDLLNDQGFTSVAVGSSADRAATWAANREVFALSDLLGYRFVTPKGRSYEIVDLAEGLVDDVFPVESTLRETRIAAAWLNADFRIVFAKCKTDEADGYSLCLDSIVGILPEPDKDLHYRRARSPGEVVSDVLALRPVDFALIDAIVSSHGGGQRSPEAITTGTIIASSSIILADYVCALKMGVDPFVSRLFRCVASTSPLPRYELRGSAHSFDGWENTTPALIGSRRYRAEANAIDRLIEPWLQNLNPDLFSLKNPLDATINGALAGFFEDSKQSPTANYLLLAINLIAGSMGHILESYRTLFNKDALTRKIVSLGFDPKIYGANVFDQIVEDLETLSILASSGPERASGLRWRIIDQAVVFAYDRVLDIDFDLFVERVDVANAIQFMNDYMGGVVVAIERDERGRPIRQAERNIYLPQPNYLVLFHGKPIDVTKLERVTYSHSQHSLFWKTIHSNNGSAQYDDGKATFSRTKEGNTAVSIVGRQLFTLPLFWQVFNLEFAPDLRSALVTSAYQTFFDRTVANFEALVEGRDIRLGRPLEQSPKSESDQLLAILEQISVLFAPLLIKLGSTKASLSGASENPIDSDGFVHGIAPNYPLRQPNPPADDLSQTLLGFIDGLKNAVAQDFAKALKSQ